jgi:hypothetical protein
MSENIMIDTDLPYNYSYYSTEVQQNILIYLNHLNEIEKKAYLIAKNHLGTSFDIRKSIGYIEWKQKK